MKLLRADADFRPETKLFPVGKSGGGVPIDGGEFGLGCEMGISTQRLHARGPMGLAELCSYKYVVRGTGQVR